MVGKILEAQKKMKEEEERLKKLEEERIKKEEEAIKLKEEKERLEKERKERKKQKEKEKIQKLKAEGKYLTDKQKEDRRRAQQLVETLRAQGVVIGTADENKTEKPKKIIYGKIKKNFNKDINGEKKRPTSPTIELKLEEKEEEKDEEEKEGKEEEEEKPEENEETEEEEDDVKDNWDESSEGEEENEEEEEEEEDDDDENKDENKKTEIKKDNNENKKTNITITSTITTTKTTTTTKTNQKTHSHQHSHKKSTNESEEEEEEEEDDGKSPQEKAHDKVLARINKKKQEAEMKKSAGNLRAPVVCVLGHVDTGKTKILDKLRRTNVQDGEAGGITQQIGATNVPQGALKEQTKMCKGIEITLPGLLIIDTPGHESFSNLRTRGSSLCDLAILVVDIMHGLEPQTIESINILKKKKTPFVVALNKIDRLFGWITNPHSDISNLIKKQKQNTKLEFDERVNQVIVQFAEQGLNAKLSYDNKNPREYISMVPTSAHSGDGMGNLIYLICELSESLLIKKIMKTDVLEATVMEVKAIPGHGTTIDVILVNGKLTTGSHIVVAGQDGPIVTQIRSLLLPQPMHELRVKSQFETRREVEAAQGCKIAAKDLEKAMAGLPLFVASGETEEEIYKEELSTMLSEVLGEIKLSEKGVYVQASTLGSLEALLSFLKSSDIPYSGINIGPVHKRDIMKASVMIEHDPQYAVILAFDVKVEKEAQEMADSLGIKVFAADIIYHLFDKFINYRDEYKKIKQEQFRQLAVFPCKLRILPEHVYNSRDPIVVGVVVEAGFIKEGTVLCVPSKEFIDIGRISSIEINHKIVDKATKGQEVCIKIESIPGESPKLFGRHFDSSDVLVSKISRSSIDAVKNWFRDQMSKSDWQLIMELKKIFEII